MIKMCLNMSISKTSLFRISRLLVDLIFFSYIPVASQCISLIQGVTLIHFEPEV